MIFDQARSSSSPLKLDEDASPLAIAKFRTVSNQPSGSTSSREIFSIPSKPELERLSKCFERLIDEGKQLTPGPKGCDDALEALCDGEFFERRLLGVMNGPIPGG